MKKITLTTFIATLIVACMAIVCACSESKDAEDSSSAAVLGRKYYKQDYSFGEGSDDHVWMDRETTCLYFYDAKNGLNYWSQKDVDTDLGTSRQSDYEFFTYTVSGNTVHITPESGSAYSLTISGNDLTSSGGDVYKGLDMASSDYDLVNSLKPQTGKCGDDLTYSYNKKGYVLTIKGSGDMYDYTTSNQPWHGLYISSVVIEKGVTSIGNNAFNGFKITSIDVPETLKRIGSSALSSTLISSLPLPESLEEIGSYAFSDCPAEYTYLTLPKNLKKIGDWAFADITISKTLTLNEKLETIGNAVFTGVKGTLTIPNSVKSIGSLAFSGTFNKIVIGTGLESLSKLPFSAASSGTMYVNLGNPLTVEDGILAGDSKAESKWTLYVPKGSKTAYAKKAPWSYFKAIYEDESLVSGNGEPEENGEETGSSTSSEEKDEEDANDSRRGYVSKSFSGSGTSSSPYLISSAADLRLLSDKCRQGEMFKGKYFKMTTDITINRNVLNSNGEPNNDSHFERWVPIGRSFYKEKAFCGTFDGNGHYISGIYISRTDGSYMALFGIINGATIKNVTLKDSYIASGAGVVCYAASENSATCYITNCHNLATVYGSAGILGGVGTNTSIEINKCSNKGKITNNDGRCAGICSSFLGSSKMINCINYGYISGDLPGGIVSMCAGDVENCVNYGNVEGNYWSGGICSQLRNGGIVRNCVNIGIVSAPNATDTTLGALVSYVKYGKASYNYYLNTSCAKAIGTFHNGEMARNVSCSETQMKSDEMVNTLNKNKNGNAIWSTWVTGSDGYPTLEWAK